MVRPGASSDLVVVNPTDGEALGSVPSVDPKSVVDCMDRARRAQKVWGARPLAERCALMQKAGDIIAERMDELADLIVKENGKVRAEALFMDIGPTLLVINTFTHRAGRILRDERLHLGVTRHRKSYVVYKPRGVVVSITPWNYPFFMPGSDAVMALIAGNAVINKPSELTPLTSLFLKDCFEAAGLHPDLYQVLTGRGPVGSALIEAAPDLVIFTGSVPTGRKVAVACAERLIECILELGGKAPAVVCPDADMERTIQALLWGGFANAGQICASVERVYAVGSTYEPLLEGLANRARALRVGPATHGDVDIGAMTWEKQLDICESLVSDALAEGAELRAGGVRRGPFFEPTVLGNCNPSMRVMREEIFGPVVPVMKVDSVEEAMHWANDSELGLGAYLFTRDRKNAKQLASELEAGSVMVNDVIIHAGMPEMPWGGIKHSGFGVVRSERGLKALCHAQHVNLDRLMPLQRDPYWFPYTTTQNRHIEGFVRRTFGKSLGGRILRSLLR